MKNKLLISSLLLLISISLANANTNKYYCSGKVNQFFIIFNTQEKTINIGNRSPKKYWTKANYTFWHSARDHTVYEYTFENSYNKLSGKLRVKSHHLVTSEDKWFDYECTINQ